MPSNPSIEEESREHAAETTLDRLFNDDDDDNDDDMELEFGENPVAEGEMMLLDEIKHPDTLAY